MAARIDFHTHIIPADLPDFSQKYGGERWPTLQPTCSCGANIMVGGKLFREITDQCWDPQKRIADMIAEGVDMQVLSPIPVTFSYWAPSEAAEAMARLQNDFIADTVRQYPDRFIGLGTVPLQDVESSIREMDRCIHQLGLKGIEIGSNINGQNLDDPAFLPFLRCARSGTCRCLSTRGRRWAGSGCRATTSCTPSECRAKPRLPQRVWSAAESSRNSRICASALRTAAVLFRTSCRVSTKAGTCGRTCA